MAPLEYEYLLLDTEDIGIDATGVLIKLFCMYLRLDGRLRDNNVAISQPLGISRQRYQALKARLVEFDLLRVERGLLFPFGALDALVAVELEADRWSRLGKRGAHARWHREAEVAQAIAQ
jgi:hypothetical protein